MGEIKKSMEEIPSPMDHPLPTLGPNTNAPRSLLGGDVIICAGEDRVELERGLNEFGLANNHFQYRCYQWWRTGDLTVIWTGIGTGCLEPLLFEILRPRSVRRICLVGSAGTIREPSCPPGTPCWIESAYSLGMSIDRWVGESALYPRWAQPLAHSLLRTTIVSTDFYYITSPAGLERFAHRLPPDFADRYRERLKTCELIDMETAAYFFFCDLFGDETLEEYVAVKGASNSVEHQEEQVTHSARVVQQSLRAAIERWQSR
jgi:hypothetical protein